MPPAQVTASTDASSDNRTRESRPQLSPKSPTVLPGAGDPKQRPGSGSLLPSAGDGQWLLHTHHLVSPAQAQERSCPSLQHWIQVALGGLAGRHGPTWELGVAPEMLGFPGGTIVVKNPPTKARDGRDTSLIPGLGTSPGGGHSNPLQYSCLENPMDKGAWWATVHGVAKNRTRQSTQARGRSRCWSRDAPSSHGPAAPRGCNQSGLVLAALGSACTRRCPARTPDFTETLGSLDARKRLARKPKMCK